MKCYDGVECFDRAGCTEAGGCARAMTHPQPPPDGAGRAEAWAAFVAEQSKHTPGADFTRPIWQVEFHHFYAGWLAALARSRPAPPAAEPVAVVDREPSMPFAQRVVWLRKDPLPVGTKLYTHPAAPAPAGPGKEGG